MIRELSLHFKKVKHTDSRKLTILVWKQSTSFSTPEQTRVQYGSTTCAFILKVLAVGFAGCVKQSSALAVILFKKGAVAVQSMGLVPNAMHLPSE